MGGDQREMRRSATASVVARAITGAAIGAFGFVIVLGGSGARTAAASGGVSVTRGAGGGGGGGAANGALIAHDRLVAAATTIVQDGGLDLGPMRPSEPPASRHARRALAERLDVESAALERAMRAARGPELDAIGLALAVRRAIGHLAATDDPAAQPSDADVVLAWQLAADLDAWDALARRMASAPGAVAPAGADAEPLTERERLALSSWVAAAGEIGGLRGDARRERLARAADDVLSAVDPVGAFHELGGAVGAAGPGGAGSPAGVDGASAAAIAAAVRLDEAIERTSWLASTGARFQADRREAALGVSPRGVAGDADVLDAFIAIIDRVERLDPRGRRRTRLRTAMEQLDAAWPVGADADARREVARGLERLSILIGHMETRQEIGRRLAPADLPIELRRLAAELDGRAASSELAALDVIDELLLGEEPGRDPGRLAVVAAMRAGVDGLGRLEDRGRWLDAVTAFEPAVVDDVRGRLDTMLLRLAAPGEQAAAAARLATFERLMNDLRAPRGWTMLRDGGPLVERITDGRADALVRGFAAARRAKLRQWVGRDAGPEAATIEAWVEFLGMLDDVVVLDAVRQDPDAAGDVRVRPGWVDPPEADHPMDAAIRALARAASSAAAMGARDAGLGLRRQLESMREAVGVARAWGAADAAGRPRVPGAPASLVLAAHPAADPDVVRLVHHRLEAAAARAADRDDDAEAHDAMAAWIASTVFDGSRERSAGR